jgi:hypothetical protein
MVGSKKYSIAVFALNLALLPILPCGQPHYQRNITATANWTTSDTSSLSDGAILFTSTQIKPYFPNLAAIGLARTANPAYYLKVKDWMRWVSNSLLMTGGCLHSSH